VKTRIATTGIAASDCYESPKPEESGSAPGPADGEARAEGPKEAGNGWAWQDEGLVRPIGTERSCGVLHSRNKQRGSASKFQSCSPQPQCAVNARS
jgi:hypothetical protein